MTDKKPLIIIGGPTASGKSDIAVALCKRIGGEIISADSMQAYRTMDIGTAKITCDEMDGVTHYGIDILNPDEEYNIESFKKMAVASMNEIYSKGKIPVLVGGTGFYIQAVLYNISFDKNGEADETIRQELTNILNKNGPVYLHNMLKEIDPESADAIHFNNSKRVIRAIEYYRLTGKKISEHNEQEKAKESPYNYCFFVMNDEREKLYERINRRVDKMVSLGLLEEINKLITNYPVLSKTAREAIGYREIFEYLDGQCSLDEAIENIKLNSRHYAKRQVTWFKREQETIWINRSDFSSNNKIISQMCDTLHKKGIMVKL